MSEKLHQIRPPPVDLRALTDWMNAEGLESGALQNIEYLAGGTQNILLKFNRGQRGFVLRRPPIHLRKNSNKTMQREAKVLAALSGSDVPHPGFIARCDDESVLGACFYLMEPVEGFNPINGLPDLHRADPKIRRQMGLSYIDAIAALGAVDYLKVGLKGFGKPDGFLQRQPTRWLEQLESYTKFENWTGFSALPPVDPIVNWLVDHMPKNYKPGIIHGDCHIGNAMFANDSGEIAALIDWELSTIGDPLMDLGWVMATWPDKHSGDFVTNIEPWTGFPKMDELIKRYSDQSDRSIDAYPWYGVMACFKLGSILEGTHARASAGKAPKKIGDDLHAHTVGLFERAQRIIAAN